MPRIIEVIRRLLPRGPNPSKSKLKKLKIWDQAPQWPPDLFAVAASLVKLSECYSHCRYTIPPVAGNTASSKLFDDHYLDEVTRLGSEWSRSGTQPIQVQSLWKKLLGYGEQEVSEKPDPPSWLDWWDFAMKIMAVSDEASKGIGFLEKPGQYPYSDYVSFSNFRLDFYEEQENLPFLPSSLCMMVPEEEVCVQPKSRTPEVGCTLRSFSHHLALLPSVKEVTTRWMVGLPKWEQIEQPLNILLIPFPYKVNGNCFRGETFRVPSLTGSSNSSAHFFTIEQKWLSNTESNKIANFIIDLVNCAKKEAGEVHGVILPEIALSKKLAQEVSEILESTSLQFFITGALSSTEDSGQLHENGVFSYVFGSRDWEQRKHHRWRLDSSQIQRYHLGHTLDPHYDWWEKIDVYSRTCAFYVFRPGASLATFVCEDLARIDPVQTALRSIGPNLLIALLMDGPQFQFRWPSRYATVLAEDPGSAVLTLTSLGMVERSVMPGKEKPRQIALWRDYSGNTHELLLPRNAHALLITISTKDDETKTMDGRSDGKNTVNLFLSGVREIVHRNPEEYDWIDY